MPQGAHPVTYEPTAPHAVHRARAARYAVALGLAGCVFAWILFMTRAPNPAIGPDSVSYLSAAESIARGEGPRIPFASFSEPAPSARLRHFPPAFPAAIAIVHALGLDPVQAARVIEALAGALSAALLVLIVARASAGRAALAGGALAAALAFTSPGIARAHAVVLSEPLFLVFFLLLVLELARARPRPLALGCSAACAAMVRYAGVSLCVAAGIALLLERGGLRARLSRAFVAVLPTAIGLGLWQRWTGSFRHYGYKPGLAATVSEAGPTLSAWLVPRAAPSTARALLALGLLVAIAALVHHALRAPRPAPLRSAFVRLVRGSSLVAGAYLSIVTLSRAFADPDIPFDWRLLAPPMLLVSVVFATALARSAGSLAPGARAAAFALVALWLGASGSIVYKEARDTHRRAWGYGSAEWQESQLAAWLRREGARYALYSDNPAALWQLARVPSRVLPERADPESLLQFARRVREQRSAVLAVRGPLIDTVAPEVLAAKLGLRLYARLDRADVWVSEPGPIDLARASR